MVHILCDFCLPGSVIVSIDYGMVYCVCVVLDNKKYPKEISITFYIIRSCFTVFRQNTLIMFQNSQPVLVNFRSELLHSLFIWDVITYKCPNFNGYIFNDGFKHGFKHFVWLPMVSCKLHGRLRFKTVTTISRYCVTSVNKKCYLFLTSRAFKNNSTDMMKNGRCFLLQR